MSDSDSTATTWVTVAEAAEKAHIDSGTVRQWYRSGRIPTRRAEGERGAFLVPLQLVLDLVSPPEAAAAAPSIEEAIRGLNADHWSGEATSAREELESVRAELAEAREQVERLREQLAQGAREHRSLKEQLEAAEDRAADLRAELADAVDDRKGVEARLATVEAELIQLRRTAARGSITDHSWLDLQTPAYQSPVRRQAMAADPAPVSPAPPAGGPTAPFTEARSSELADLLAATRPDGADDDPPDTGDRGPEAGRARFLDDGDDRSDEYTNSRAIWTDEAPHPPLGESPDDLLPEPDRKGRFGKK